MKTDSATLQEAAGAGSSPSSCSQDWWVVDRNNGDAKINGPHGSAETAGSVRHVLELNASEEQNERWNLCVVRIPENDQEQQSLPGARLATPERNKTK